MVEELWLQKKYDILLIKLFDRIHNMQTLGVKSQEKIIRITKETVKHFLSVSIFVDSLMCKEMKIERLFTELCSMRVLTKKRLLLSSFAFTSDDYQMQSPTFQNDAMPAYIRNLLV